MIVWARTGDERPALRAAPGGSRGRLVHQAGRLTAHVLACCGRRPDVGRSLGLQVLGSAGWLSIGPLLVWSVVLFLVGACRARTDSPAASGRSNARPTAPGALADRERGLDRPGDSGRPPPGDALAPAAGEGRQRRADLSPLLRGPVVEGGAAVPGGHPLRRERRDVFPGQRRPLVHLADGRLGRRPPRPSRPGPFLLVAALAAYGMARTLGAGRNSSLLATCWFVTSSPFLLFSFEANVDTIFVAGYLTAAYFFLLYAGAAGGSAASSWAGWPRDYRSGPSRSGSSSFLCSCSSRLGAIAARGRALRRILGASLVVLTGRPDPCRLLVSAATCLLTGNPLYPLHVELFGQDALAWLVRSRGDDAQPVLPADRRLAGPGRHPAGRDRPADGSRSGWPRWPGPGPSARERMAETGRWVWALSLLAVLNIAFYWIFIPYRTQQRFMLQALGLAVVPLARLLDRGRCTAGARRRSCWPRTCSRRRHGHSRRRSPRSPGTSPA